MTRYHFFNFMYPTEANKIHQGYADMTTAFTKLTGIDKLMVLFKFTPRDWDRPKDEGTEVWSSDEISIE